MQKLEVSTESAKLEDSYVCVESIIIDNNKYNLGDRIGEDAYAFLQPIQREHFELV